MKDLVCRPCSDEVYKRAVADGDCQASKAMAKQCPYEWLGVCNLKEQKEKKEIMTMNMIVREAVASQEIIRFHIPTGSAMKEEPILVINEDDAEFRVSTSCPGDDEDDRDEGDDQRDKTLTLEEAQVVAAMLKWYDERKAKLTLNELVKKQSHKSYIVEWPNDPKFKGTPVYLGEEGAITDDRDRALLFKTVAAATSAITVNRLRPKFKDHLPLRIVQA